MSLKIREIINTLEILAPLEWQEEWDNAGIQVGDPDRELTGILLCVDVTESIIDEAIRKNCNLIISHHPLLFRPLRSIQGRNYIERCVIKACKHDLLIYAAHTNLDNAPGGVNYRLAQKLELMDVEVLEKKENMFSAEGKQVGMGVVGNLPTPFTPSEFIEKIQTHFSVNCIHAAERIDTPIKRVAICGGSGASLRQQAEKAGADVFLTGEARYNDYLDAAENILMLTIGHFESEECAIQIFYEEIRKKFITFDLNIVCVNSNPIKYL